MESQARNILITGSSGFIGKNLVASLQQRKDVVIRPFDINDDQETLKKFLATADIIFHLAGVNRPVNEDEFQSGNVGLTSTIVDLLRIMKRTPTIVFSSSIQATLDNPYGRSKKLAEDIIRQYSYETRAKAFVFRLSNVYGKWCRPQYNSVVATFCYQIANDLPITISDSSKEIEIVYIDDVVHKFISLLDDSAKDDLENQYCTVTPIYRIMLGKLAETIKEFRAMRKTLYIAPMRDRLQKTLYTTYLSYLQENDFGYILDEKKDNRGILAELYKSPDFGQVFVSRTHPGITRGNHYHHTKVEKFCVVDGEGLIRFRHILSNKVLEYRVSSTKLQIVDIPPGYTHSIENVGTGDMITIFWANEIFNPNEPDTYNESVF
jgi:UDP-2-acetamido-2,6-beta-L-arabino-hexul-4-ose reductase